MELKELAEQVKSAKTLVDLAWSIGKAVVQAGYEKHQADRACSEYLNRYEQRHAHVKILGMTEPVPLASIYTEVRVVPPIFLRGYRTQQELQELFLQKERSLTGYDFSCDKPEPGLKVANDEKHRFLNVLGAPGSGKSTFLRYIGLMALQSYRLSTIAQVLRDPDASSYRFNVLPVLLELRTLRNVSLDFVALIDEELQTNGFPANFGHAALQTGGLLVLLDGLDEVPADKLDDTIQGIRNLVDQHPECRYVISCRTAFYKDYFTRFNDVLLTDFTDDQIQNLIENWFRSDHDRELNTATTLWGLLKDPKHQATRELARTPLLATFLCLVYDDRQKLPTNRAELYGDALRILLERWTASKRVRVHGEPVFPGLTIKRELLMLEEIAGPAYEREQYFFTAQELATAIEGFLQSDAGGPDKVDGRMVLEEIERKQGLLVQRAHDKYSFSHLTLHEFLAACHYYKSGRSREVYTATLSEKRWREVHLLLAGLQEPHADAFLMAIATTTAEQVTSEHFKKLLGWAEQVVRVDGSPQQTAARRALIIVFALALDLALALDRVRALDIDRALDRVRDLALALDRDRDLALARALALALALALDLDRALDLDLARVRVRALDPALDRARVHDPALDLYRVRDRVRVIDRVRALDLAPVLDLALDLYQILGSIITDHRIIAIERSEEFVKACNTLDRHLKIRRPLTDAALEELANTPGFPPLDPYLSEWDVQQFSDFLICTQRVFECREAAERVTQAGWDRVCERLFALPRST